MASGHSPPRRRMNNGHCSPLHRKMCVLVVFCPFLGLWTLRQNNSTLTTFTEFSLERASFSNQFVDPLRKDGKSHTNMAINTRKDLVLPNILHIGAYGAGSNSIKSLLDVCGAKALDGEPQHYSQQVNFFNIPERFNQGVEFYARRFEHCRQQPFALDATPHYLRSPDVSLRVHDLYKDAGRLEDLKILVSVRDPIAAELTMYNELARAYTQKPDPNAWYKAVAKKDGSLKSFDEYAKTRLIPSLQQKIPRGDVYYAQQLKPWFEQFDRKQILVLSYHELQQNPNATKSRIQEFIGVGANVIAPKDRKVRYEDEADFPQKVILPSCSVQEELFKLYEPMNSELYQLLESNPGPAGEQNPFPAFERTNCTGSSVQPAADPDELTLPNILLIGAPKSGSTALAFWLIYGNDVCHGRVFDGEPGYYQKEVKFFDQPERFQQGVKFYARRFEHCREEPLIMDATPSYIFEYQAPKRVKSVYTDVGQLENLKILAILREPFGQLLSLYNHKVHDYLEKPDLTAWYKDVANADGSLKSFDEYAEAMLPTLEKGNSGANYAKQLKPWFKMFDRRQILILSYDELQHNPNTTMWRVQEFLGGTPLRGELPTANTKARKGKVNLPSCVVREKLGKYFESFNSDLYNLLESNPGPVMEQRPFQPFLPSNCTEEQQQRREQQTESTNQEEAKDSNNSSLVLPNILLIGTIKAGTTSTAEWLFFNNSVCHGRIFDGEPHHYEKEVKFFDTNARFEQGVEFYARRFEHCHNERLIMDATVSYILNPNVPSRVHSVYKAAGQLDDLKILAIFREPIAMEVSLYNHKVYDYLQDPDPTAWYKDVLNKDANGTIKTFEEYAESNLIPFLQKNKSRASYAKQLKPWFELFDRKQMLILSYDELQQSPNTVTRRIQEFLVGDTPMVGTLPNSNNKARKGKVKLLACSVHERLAKFYEPMNAEFYRLLESNPGPVMEQRPITAFQPSDCIRE